MDAIKSPLLTAKQAIRYLGLKNTGTLAVWRHYSKGPRYVEVGREFKYRLSDLEAYITENVRTPGQPRDRKAA